MEKLLIKRIELDFNESDSTIIDLDEIVKNEKVDLGKKYPDHTISYKEEKTIILEEYLIIVFSIIKPKGFTGLENL